MPHTDREGARIYFETAGDPSHPPVVLIEGLGAQLVGWRDGFVEHLVDRGLHVVRLDNRDVGLSEMFGGSEDYAADYTLTDMAGDVCRVLDTLGLQAAHVVGQSMGGAIAQTLAIEHPDRVRSLVLIYTAAAFTENVFKDEALERAGNFPPSATLSREAAVAAFVESQALCASSAYPQDITWLREQGGICYDRAHRPDGIYRQTSVILASGDRRPALAKVTVPTAVIHGRGDRLVSEEASVEIARLMPQAELHLYPGMGHEIARPLWGDFATIIERTVSRA